MGLGFTRLISRHDGEPGVSACRLRASRGGSLSKPLEYAILSMPLGSLCPGGPGLCHSNPPTRSVPTTATGGRCCCATVARGPGPPGTASAASLPLSPWGLRSPAAAGATVAAAASRLVPTTAPRLDAPRRLPPRDTRARAPVTAAIAPTHHLSASHARARAPVAAASRLVLPRLRRCLGRRRRRLESPLA